MDLKNKLFIKFMDEQTSGGYQYKTSGQKRAAVRRYWHRFVKYRQTIGLCIQCNRRHQPTMQRCGLHRRLNAEKCLAWARANAVRLRQERAERVRAGLCASTASHGKATHGTLCKKCRLTARRTQ